jgi:hypothetical protein
MTSTPETNEEVLNAQIEKAMSGIVIAEHVTDACTAVLRAANASPEASCMAVAVFAATIFEKAVKGDIEQKRAALHHYVDVVFALHGEFGPDGGVEGGGDDGAADDQDNDMSRDQFIADDDGA